MGGYLAKHTALVYESGNLNPAATTSVSPTKVMMGLAGAFTPRGSRVLITMHGDIRNGTSGSGSQWQMRYGTGSAPANAAADTGTAAGSAQNLVVNGTTMRVPFSETAIIQNLVPGTAYWFDMALCSVTSGTSTFGNVRISITEV